MTQYLLIPFYQALAPRHSKDDPVEYETRVVGRVPRDFEQHRLDMSLVTPGWALGYPLEADDLNGVVEQCRWSWRWEGRSRVTGGYLVNRNNVPENDDPTVFLYDPTTMPPMASIKFHDIGTYHYEGVDRTVLVVMCEHGLSLDGTYQYRSDGYYHESTARGISRDHHPELVTFVFQRMRELGFKSTKEENQ